MRGAWIEINPIDVCVDKHSRSPCGERGLKYELSPAQIEYLGRSPCGERGLKYDAICQEANLDVAPHAGSVD